MKRLMLILAFVLSTVFVFGQTATLTFDHERLERRLERSNEDIEHDKRSENPRTWYNRGKLMQEIFDVNNVNFLRKEMSKVEITLLLGEPDEIRTITDDGESKEVYVYKGVELTIQNDQLIGWKETKFVTDNPLDKALEAYKKALELDDRGRMESRMKDDLIELRAQYQRKALEAYEEERYGNAFDSFEKMLEVNSFEFINETDTLIMYYTGLAAHNAEDFENARKYYEKVIDLEFEDPRVFVYLKNIHLEQGDTTQALNTLQKGFETFPNENLLVIELVNHYLGAGEAEEALEYLSIAKEQDPTNKSFYFAEGTLYDRLNDFENAKKAYEQALQIDPEYFDATYNFGVLYFNNAVKLFEAANQELDNTKYQEKRKTAEEELKNAVPYMEKAHEIRPDDRSTLETLKTLYYRLQLEEKLAEVDRKLEEL